MRIHSCIEVGKEAEAVFVRLYDLWQGLWFIKTGVTPKDANRRGYKSFLEFCDVDEKSYVPDAERGMWPLFAQEWICPHARVQIRHDKDAFYTDISKVYSLRAYSMADWRERDVRWKAHPEQVNGDAQAS
jgi:hypothetical protein